MGRVRTIPVMPISCTDPARPWVARLALLGPLPTLTACSETGLGLGAWLFLTLSLALAAGLAFALGQLRARQRSAAELRSAREAARVARQLQEGWRWQSDAQHRLVSWRSPGPEGPQDAQAGCAFFEPASADALLMQQLQARLPFGALRLHSPVPIDGSRGWELRGEPCQDEAGAFAGFLGGARPLDEADALRWSADTVGPLLDSHAQPALVVQQGPTGWQLRRFNAAASAAWPALLAGGPLSVLPEPTAAALGVAMDKAVNAETIEAQGWRVAALAPLPQSPRVLLLLRLAPATPAADSAVGHEGETFSSTLTHDLRAPIRVVEGFTRIVKEDYGRHLDRVGNEHLDRVLGAAARMNQMIDALLALARLSQQPLARQSINLSQLAGFVVDDLRRAAPDRAAEFDIEPGLTAWGDPTLMRLVLENLFGNAWKYTQRCSQALISLGSVPHGNHRAYVVRDNGAGFNMASADRLFGLFQRLHSASDFPGHGVGLASVRRIVRRHGGEVWAEAEAGRGAAFFFTLPD